MRLLTGTEVSPRTVIRKKIADAKEEEKTDAKKRTLAVVLVIVVCSVVLASVLANWTGRFSRGGQSERQIEFHDEPPAVRTHPKILTVFASKNHDALLKFKSPLHDMARWPSADRHLRRHRRLFGRYAAWERREQSSGRTRF